MVTGGLAGQLSVACPHTITASGGCVDQEQSSAERMEPQKVHSPSRALQTSEGDTLYPGVYNPRPAFKGRRDVS